MPTAKPRVIRRAAAPAPAEPVVCYQCSTVPFGSVSLISLLSAIVCVLSVLVVLSSLVVQTQQARLRQLTADTAAATR